VDSSSNNIANILFYFIKKDFFESLLLFFWYLFNPRLAGSHAERFLPGVGFWHCGTAKNPRRAQASVSLPRPSVVATPGGPE
jgi:hypothetical protein